MPNENLFCNLLDSEEIDSIALIRLDDYFCKETFIMTNDFLKFAINQVIQSITDKGSHPLLEQFWEAINEGKVRLNI